MRQRQILLGKLKRDHAATHLVGMPWEHALVFMQIARHEGCVISSRQLGRVCMGLMTEGYDTKGFRIKSKSCDFGPMAGFICADERFHKKGSGYNATQKKDIDHAIHGDKWDKTGVWKAGVEQICLTHTRFLELKAWDDDENKGARIETVKKAVTRGGLSEEYYLGSMTAPVPFYYVLRKEVRMGDSVLALYYTDKKLPQESNILWQSPWQVLANELKLKPMQALTNPYTSYPKGHYKNCCTGDYDLFGVWPRKKNYEALGEDRRIAGMPIAWKGGGIDPGPTNNQIIEWEDKRLGNLSNRVHTVAQLLNSAANIDAKPCRNIVNHSDEAGRPFISGIDDHVIAFIPGPQGVNYIVGVESPRGMPNIAQWQAFFTLCIDMGFQVVVNAFWMTQLRQWGLDSSRSVTMGDARGWRIGHDSPARSS
jgi:hypothetical protein